MSGPARRALLSPDQAWALTVGLLAVHQTEEVVYSMEAWLEHVGSTGWPLLDAHIRGPAGIGNPLADVRPSRRLAAVGAQALAAGVLWAYTRRSDRATRVLATGLCLGWSAAFVTHIAVSARTRSAMPGLATSLLPGLPGAALTLRAIWA